MHEILLYCPFYCMKLTERLSKHKLFILHIIARILLALCYNKQKFMRRTAMKRVVITVLGADRVGIIAAVTKVLAEQKINVLSINQTILDGFFNMVLMGDMTDAELDMQTLQKQFADLGESMGLDIRAQLADVFYKMHRV